MLLIQLAQGKKLTSLKEHCFMKLSKRAYIKLSAERLSAEDATFRLAIIKEPQISWTKFDGKELSNKFNWKTTHCFTLKERDFISVLYIGTAIDLAQ